MKCKTDTRHSKDPVHTGETTVNYYSNFKIIALRQNAVKIVAHFSIYVSVFLCFCAGYDSFHSSLFFALFFSSSHSWSCSSFHFISQ